MKNNGPDGVNHAGAKRRARDDRSPTRASIAIADIVLGKRHRKDMGDIPGLAASIDAIGLLNPITVDENGHLLAGALHFAACKVARLEEVEVRIAADT